MTFTATPPELIVNHDTPPPGFWRREPSHFPLPMSPFTKVLMRQEEWGRELAAELGALYEGIRFSEINGWIYIRVVPLGTARCPRLQPG